MTVSFSDASTNTAKLLSPLLVVNGTKCLLLEIDSTEGYLFILSVGMYNDNKTIETLRFVPSDHVLADRQVAIALPEGEYRLVFEVLGTNATVNLGNISLANEMCQSAGKKPSKSAMLEIHFGT
jgi:hypothetical protein